MKIYEQQEVENLFNEILELISIETTEEKDLSVFSGRLSLVINSRITQLQKGLSKSSSKESEIKRLQNAKACLKSKINNTTKLTLLRELQEACKAYTIIQ